MHPRLQYVVSVLQSYTMGVRYTHTCSKEEFKMYPGPSINYSPSTIKSHELFIKDSGNLYRKLEDFKQPAIRKSVHQFQLFPESDSERFDLFAAIFYLLARVEEYQWYDFDKHQRFTANSSVLHVNGVLHLAVIDEWIFSLLKELESLFKINIKVEQYQPQWSLGVDIDQFYKHKYKSPITQLAGTIRDFAYGNFASYLERIQIYCGITNDPYDCLIHFKNIGIS